MGVNKAMKYVMGAGFTLLFRIFFLCLCVMVVALICGFAVSENTSTIIIDPGHGGVDGGAVGVNGVCEKDLNLLLSINLKEHFENKGYRVVMTRYIDTDTDEREGFHKKEDIQNRLKLSEKYGPNAVYLMIHMNASTSSSDKGFQVFYGSVDKRRSGLLAESIYECVEEYATVTRLREVKEAPGTVYLSRNISIPCVLIECGFISNETDANLLGTPEYRKNLAYVIYCGVERYLTSELSGVVK